MTQTVDKTAAQLDIPSSLDTMVHAISANKNNYQFRFFPNTALRSNSNELNFTCVNPVIMQTGSYAYNYSSELLVGFSD